MASRCLARIWLTPTAPPGPPVRPCDAGLHRNASPCEPSRLYLGPAVPYEPRVRIFSAVLVPLILVLPLWPLWPAAISSAQAQKKAGAGQKKVEFTKGPTGKTPGVCGAKILPLVEGNQWTYGFVASGTEPPPELIKLLPSEPSTIVITVKSIESKSDTTVVHLEEKTTADISKDPKKHILDERTINSTITCSKTKFEISPDSFFFAGEPGGYFGIEFDKLERPKDTTWKLAGGQIGDQPWREEIIAHFTRAPFESSGAKHDSGKLELEHTFTPAQPESVNAPIGLYTLAEKLAVTTTGRVTLDHQVDPKPQELPGGWVNFLWLYPNTGVVQVLNKFAHKYQLVAAQLK
jgi:hypothetical protein